MLLIVVITINITGFLVVALDKYKAIEKKWRIPERAFFQLAILGGGPGIYLGLVIFKHKTRHLYFMIGIPLIMMAQIIIVYLAIYKFG